MASQGVVMHVHVLVKIDQHYLFKIFALPFGSDISTPSDLKGVMLQESFILDLMYDQNFFCGCGFSVF